MVYVGQYGEHLQNQITHSDISFGQTKPPQTLLPFYNLLKESHDLLKAGKIREAILKVSCSWFIDFKMSYFKNLAFPANNNYSSSDIWQLPKLDTSEIKTYEEKLLAHKVLSFLASQYVWQGGPKNPSQVRFPLI